VDLVGDELGKKKEKKRKRSKIYGIPIGLLEFAHLNLSLTKS